ncbi:MAG: flagellar protein [Hoeflea sp.]|uniref:flagellar protein n=1 Tax=Hoeflea sp. TaxID=1940281 RepID=UPI001D527B8C|nr:flagellar protein [Hoeflea sp.]MBU4531130.1 flagellar protein [Alphaproteobacteria bacterium]MBU4545808.1 flagellar protein [Alphaproteobacteria bacterium]MBU4550777.1 flagellar protein [Alphaproteobacteria bacterium]MBV1724407.1 flagellar protein [Hoeflea sp.]MBV1760427.1 flagellar protein [Hoeflea sp.]
MTDPIDLDDDEAPVPVAKSGRSGDRVFAVAGFVLATAAAFFPWYVFFNQESFGIAPMGYTDTRDLPETPGRAVVTVSPLAIPDEEDGSAPASAFDPIITATVPESGDQGNGSSRALSEDPIQPFPGKPQYRLLHVANGRALIEDRSGMYIVRIGSVLPDNSRLATLEQRDGKWVIITSNGEVIQR